MPGTVDPAGSAPPNTVDDCREAAVQIEVPPTQEDIRLVIENVTNAEHIQGMSDDELHEYIKQLCATASTEQLKYLAGAA